jgi:hypothetical protein
MSNRINVLGEFAFICRDYYVGMSSVMYEIISVGTVDKDDLLALLREIRSAKNCAETQCFDEDYYELCEFENWCIQTIDKES